MAKTLRALFDGEVLRPDAPVGLEPNTRYVVTVEREDSATPSDEAAYPLTQLLGYATDMGVTDLSTRHSWYAYGRLEGDTRGT
jgi:hypothetical protein